jgi:putative membrane protein
MAVLALTAIAIAAILYRLGRRGVSGSRARRDRTWRAQAFYAGLIALALAIAPPLDDLADRLFWAHMAQHALLQMVAPPLIVLGAPWLAIWRGLSLGGRRRSSRWLVQSRGAAPLRLAARALTVPAVAWVLFLGAIWISHLPAVFDFAARNAAIHETEHLLFLGLGLLFWSRVFDSPPFHARLIRFRRLGFLLAAVAAETALSVAILAAHRPLYAPYSQLIPRPEHLTALADQQLGGAIMLEPASIPLVLAILWSLGKLGAPGVGRVRNPAA